MSETAVQERPKRRMRRDYTEVERNAALQAYVIAAGDRRKASKLLAEQGIEVPGKTIYDWARRTDIPRYERMRKEVEPLLRQEMADMHLALARSAGEIEAQAVERLREKLNEDSVEAKDLSALMQRAAIATGIHGEKNLLYSDRPTQIVERDLSEVMRELKSLGFRAQDVIELEPAQVVEEASDDEAG